MALHSVEEILPCLLPLMMVVLRVESQEYVVAGKKAFRSEELAYEVSWEWTDEEYVVLG